MSRHKPEIAIAVLLLLIPVWVWVYWYVRLSREIRAEWGLVRAEGYPACMADVERTFVPDDQNAATGYMRAMRELTSFDHRARTAGVPSPKREALDAADAYYPGASPARRERLRAAFGAPAVKNALAETIEASRLPACAFPQPARQFTVPGPSARQSDEHFVLLALIGDLIQRMGMLYEADGDTTGALECDFTLLRMARHALQCPSLPAQAVGTQMLVQGVGSIAGRVRPGGLTQAQLREVSRELDATDRETALRNAIGHMRARFFDEVFRTIGSRRARLEGRCPHGRATLLRWVPYSGRWVQLHESLHAMRSRLYFTTVGLPWHKRDELEFLRLCRQLLALARRPPGLAAKAAEQLGRSWWDMDMVAFAPATAGFARHGRDVIADHAWAATTLAECRVALALQAFHRSHGRYPASMNELTAASALPVPPDPHSGKPFRYRLADDGACEYYSLGPNGRDDGGQHTVLIINLGDLIEDDSLWRCVSGRD